jgi:hypothetical protein
LRALADDYDRRVRAAWADSFPAQPLAVAA